MKTLDPEHYSPVVVKYLVILFYSILVCAYVFIHPSTNSRSISE